jgi:hypothetical protein
MVVVNTLAYHDKAIITAVKIFIVQATGYEKISPINKHLYKVGHCKTFFSLSQMKMKKKE